MGTCGVGKSTKSMKETPLEKEASYEFMGKIKIFEIC